jgi:cytoskeleton protein RodZ
VAPASDTPDTRDDRSEEVVGARSAAPGARLRAARESAGYSIDDIAHELHLERGVVQAIERDELDNLGAPVFVRGYLRGYARLLGLPEDELVAGWQPADADADRLRVAISQPELKPGPSLQMVVLIGLFALLVIITAVYLMAPDPAPVSATDINANTASPEPDNTERFETRTIETEEPSRPADSSAAPAMSAVEPQGATLPGPVSAADPGSGPQPASGPAAVASDETADDATPPAPPAATAANQPAEFATATDSPGVRLELAFSGECWVEVADARRRLLYGLEKPGSVRSFVAEPPLRLFVGNADAVRIRLDDQAYPVPSSARTGRNTARFTITADDIEAVQ